MMLNKKMLEAYDNPPDTFTEFLEIHKPMLAKMNDYQLYMTVRNLFFDYESLRRNGSLTL